MADTESELLDMKKILAQLVQSKKENEELMRKLVENQTQSRVENSNEMSIASLSAIESRIQEFVYDPEDGSTFERWWNRHADIFEIDLLEMDEVKKCRLLIRHMSTAVERTFTESIAPVNWTELTLKQVKEKMLVLFGDNTSTFDRRRSMLDLKMSKENIEDVRALAARVNQTVESAQISEATINEWKVLTFLHALDLPRYSDVHLKMMQSAKQKGKECTLEDLLSVYNDVSQLKRDSRAITTPSAEVNRVSWNDRRSGKYDKTSEDRDKSRPHVNQQSWKHGKTSRDSNSGKKYESYRSGCTRCGNEGHTEQKCYRKKLTCFRCDRIGHVADECSEDEDEDKGRRRSNVDTVIVNTVKSTDYSIKVKLNGVTIAMDVDTGSDITFLSEEIWRSIGAPDCLSSDCEAVCANGKQLEIVGKFMGELEYGDVTTTSEVHVASSDRVIIGRDLIEKLRILRVRSDMDGKTAIPQSEVKTTPAKTASSKMNEVKTTHAKTASSEMDGKTANSLCEAETASAKTANSKVKTTNGKTPYNLMSRYDSWNARTPAKDKKTIIQKEDAKTAVTKDSKDSRVFKKIVKEDVDITQH